MTDGHDHEPEAAIDLEAVLAAIAAREGGGAGESCALADGVARADLELLGLLAYEAEPVEPSPALRRRVLAAIRGPAAGGSDSRPGGGAVAPLDRPQAGPARWWLGLAAGVALVAVLLAGWLSVRMAARTATIAGLERRLAAAERRADDLALAHGQLLARSRELAVQLAQVTAPGVEICPLRPMRGAPMPAEARALLFMAAADGVWYLRVHDLPEPPEGAVYVLWFLGEAGVATSGGVIPAGGVEVALRRGALPATGSMSRGVAMTVERDPEAPAPSGPMVLFGDEKLGLL